MFKRTKISAGVLLALGGAVVATSMPALAQEAQRVEITGSRILKLDLSAAGPMVTVSGEEIAANQDITLETFLNTLPQVNPHGTTTSNNPGNGGQANIDLRGLGSNRNLILVDGRRAMVSASDQTVDLNTIPMSLVESIEIITGGAGAVYGADAVAGVVNIRLKRRYEGFNIRAGMSDSTEHRDSREKNFAVTTGGNFAENRGNAVLAFEYSEREGLIKSQRDFASVATSTTSFFPEGLWLPHPSNFPTQVAVDALYGQASYGGVAPGTVPNSSNHSFNADGSLIYPGVFNNSSRNVFNWRYPVDTGVNTNLFPDVYSYNFDAVNVLVLPLERRSVMAKVDFNVTDSVEVFSRFSNTNYTSRTALAPTPVSTVAVRNPANASSSQGSSALVESGQTVASALVVPVTNPFLPADLKQLLDSRTGNDPRVVGSGADEPIVMRWRTVAAGLREANYINDVTQYLLGARGDLFGTDWTWDAYISHGRTKITNKQTGNIDTNRLLATLAAADGGVSLCAGGVNPFGRQPLSAECANYLTVDNALTTEFKQTIAQAYATGEVARVPSGEVLAVVGAETRNFSYEFDPGSASGPISGFNVQSPAGGKNSFRDFFGELQIPILRKAPMADSLDLSLAFRTSQSEATDTVKNISTDKERSNTFAFTANWRPSSELSARASAQRAVRAPNFGELFDGGGSAPQVFDPCSVSSVARTSGADAASLADLCRNTGLGGAVDTFVQTPGTQASVSVAGNIDLKPEKGDSFTLGFVWAPERIIRGFRASVDFYRITVKDAITAADTNELIADCYNFYGRNSAYDPTYSSCAGIFRSGGNIVWVDDPSTDDGAFAGTNGGAIKTQGLDLQAGWTGAVGAGTLDLNMNLSYLLSYKLRTASFLPSKELSGTIPYFGAGLGQAFPKIKAALSGNYRFGDFSVDGRIRFIDKMENRMSKMFPGESFTGVKETFYLDAGGSWEFAKGATVRLGINNILDQKARTYKPNVQSGTDPSTYDVIGRRLFVQANFQMK